MMENAQARTDIDFDRFRLRRFVECLAQAGEMEEHEAVLAGVMDPAPTASPFFA